MSSRLKQAATLEIQISFTVLNREESRLQITIWIITQRTKAHERWNRHFCLKNKKENDLKKTLVLDLDETLVHASFKPILAPDVVISVRKETIYVVFRPGAEEFIEKMAKLYELVVFTASVESYARPVMEMLDKKGLCSSLLCRDHCTLLNGMYVKDMSMIGRKLEDIILLDNSPISYMYQQENGLPIVNWYDSPTDRELSKYTAILEALAFVPDVRVYIPKLCNGDQIDYWKVRRTLDEMQRKYYHNQSQELNSYHSEKQLSHYRYSATPSRSTQDISKAWKSNDFYENSENDWKCHTPAPQKDFNQINKTPMVQLNSYFDNLKIISDKYKANFQQDFSHNRLSDAAYHRKKLKNGKSVKRGKSPKSAKKIKTRPSTGNNTHRSSSWNPELHQKQFSTIEPQNGYSQNDLSGARNGMFKEENSSISPTYKTHDYFGYNGGYEKKPMSYDNICSSVTRNESIQKKVDRFLNGGYLTSDTNQQSFEPRHNNWRRFENSEKSTSLLNYKNDNFRQPYLRYSKPSTTVGGRKGAMIRAHYGNYVNCHR
jgi:Dullard-like phosphatase family protein